MPSCVTMSLTSLEGPLSCRLRHVPCMPCGGALYRLSGSGIVGFHDSQVWQSTWQNSQRLSSVCPKPEQAKKENTRDQLAFFHSYSPFSWLQPLQNLDLLTTHCRATTYSVKACSPVRLYASSSFTQLLGEVDFHLQDKDSLELDGRPHVIFPFFFFFTSQPSLTFLN